MNETVREWLDKAHGDYQTAARELRVRKGANYDAVCFHSQQCIEKLMKAALIARGTVPPKTHDLVHLSGLLTAANKDSSWPVDELRFLGRAAVSSRYPGESADKQEAAESFRMCKQLRERLLGLITSAI